MNYEEMSDFDINWKVAEFLGLRCIHERAGAVCYQMQFGGSCMVDYCNNASDAYPVIFDNKISICAYDLDVDSDEYEEMKDIWFAMKDFGKQYDHKNPLRAAMVVFLMMNEEQK